MAIDYGDRRIGVAVSASGSVATPHSMVKNEGEIIEKLARIVIELEAETIVVGIPKRAHSETGLQKFRDFAERLGQKTGKPVVLWDETFSTVEASRLLRESGRNRREAQREIDMHAAAVILQSYLDDLARRAS